MAVSYTFYSVQFGGLKVTYNTLNVAISKEYGKNHNSYRKHQIYLT